MASANIIQINIELSPKFTLEGILKPQANDRSAAWEIYVELISRISTVELKPNEGILREALTSLHSLFATSREVLKKYGPSIACYKKGQLSLGYIVLAVLNQVIRPILAKWHPLLQDYESKRRESSSQVNHERKWERYNELREVINSTRQILKEYANILADIAGVPKLDFPRNY